MPGAWGQGRDLHAGRLQARVDSLEAQVQQLQRERESLAGQLAAAQGQVSIMGQLLQQRDLQVAQLQQQQRQHQHQPQRPQQGPSAGLSGGARSAGCTCSQPLPPPNKPTALAAVLCWDRGAGA